MNGASTNAHATPVIVRASTPLRSASIGAEKEIPVQEQTNLLLVDLAEAAEEEVCPLRLERQATQGVPKGRPRS